MAAAPALAVMALAASYEVCLSGELLVPVVALTPLIGDTLKMMPSFN